MEQNTNAVKILAGVIGLLFMVLVGVGGYVVGFDQGQRRAGEANGPMLSPTPPPGNGAGQGLNTTPSPVAESVWVYFSHSDRAATDCESVFPVRREVTGAANPELAAVEALLQGPTTEERERGFETSIPAGTGIRSVSVSGGTARVDFDEGLNQGVAGSCLVQSIRAQIEETLRQFPGVSDVVISVDGETEEVLQP